jgi:hypothetical protein
LAKLTLSDITSGYSTPAKLNANNALIEAAFERCVFRDGTAPNTMLASLDMNSQRIINLPSPIDGNDAARYSDVLSLVNLDTAVPSQASNSGKVLSTNGTNLAWSFNGDDSAPLYYKRTAAEVTAGVTPTNFVYPTGDVRRYGATGDGTTDDTAALQNCAAVARAAVGLTIVFEPNKTYKIWPAGTGSTLFDLTGCNGVTVEMNGALLSAGSISGTILRVFDLNAVTNVTFRNVRYTQSYSTLDVANGGGLFVISNGSRRISFENVYQLNGLYGIVVLGEFASGGARSSQITAMNCEFENVYYPQSFQASGDNYFARNIRTIKCGRGYFPYNLRQHDVEMYSQHAGPFDDVLLTVYANPSSYNRLEQIKLRYYSDGRHASGTNQSADNAIIAFAAIQNTGTSTAAFFNDIDINVDFTPSVTPTTRKLLNFRKLTSAGAADTTARGHQFYNITIGGRVLSWADSASTQCLDFFDIDAGYNWSGDSAWNIAIKNFYATGGGSDVAIRLNGVPFAAGQGVILENVRTDMLFARSSWDEQKAMQLISFLDRFLPWLATRHIPHLGLAQARSPR